MCNRHHSVDQQLCRWLLLSLDRLSSADLTMTQELIANMLGVRREGVTEAAGRLQKLGVITGFDHALRPRGIDAQHRADAVAVLLSDPQAGIFLATRLGLRATRGH